MLAGDRVSVCVGKNKQTQTFMDKHYKEKSILVMLVQKSVCTHVWLMSTDTTNVGSEREAATYEHTHTHTRKD